METEEMIKKIEETAKQKGIIGFLRCNRGYWEEFTNEKEMMEEYKQEMYEHYLEDYSSDWIEEEEEDGSIVFRQMAREHSGKEVNIGGNFEDEDSLINEIASKGEFCECGNCPRIFKISERSELADKTIKEIYESL